MIALADHGIQPRRRRQVRGGRNGTGRCRIRCSEMSCSGIQRSGISRSRDRCRGIHRSRTSHCWAKQSCTNCSWIHYTRIRRYGKLRCSCRCNWFRCNWDGCNCTRANGLRRAAAGAPQLLARSRRSGDGGFWRGAPLMGLGIGHGWGGDVGWRWGWRATGRRRQPRWLVLRSAVQRCRQALGGGTPGATAPRWRDRAARRVPAEAPRSASGPSEVA